MFPSWFLSCVVTLLCVTTCAWCQIKQFQILVKELASVGDMFSVNSSYTNGTLQDDIFKVDKLTEEIETLKKFLEGENVSKKSFQSALDTATKEIEILKDILLKQNTSSVCTKQIEVLTEQLLKQNKPCASTKQIEELKRVASKQTKILKQVLLKQEASCTCTTMKPQTTTTAGTTATSETTPTSTQLTTELVEVTPGYVPVEERNFTIVNSISSNSSLDTKKPYLQGIVVLNQDGQDVIIVSDKNNTCLKSFWCDSRKDREFSSRLSVCENSHFPFSITKLNDYLIAVSCYSTPKIYIINVSPDLRVNNTINTHYSNYGITAVTSQNGNETRLVTGHKYGMSIINLSGVIMKEMDLDVTGKRYLKNPYFLTLTPTGNILVSDSYAWLLCITQGKKVLWKYKLGNLRDVDCDAQGNVYIVHHDEHKVIVLSAHGKFIKQVLSNTDHIENPWGIYYDSTKRRLYVTETNRFIRVFEHQ